MKAFGKVTRDGALKRLPPLTPERGEAAGRATRDVRFAARTSHRADRAIRGRKRFARGPSASDRGNHPRNRQSGAARTVGSRAAPTGGRACGRHDRLRAAPCRSCSIRSTMSWSTDPPASMSNGRASWSGSRCNSATTITSHRWRRKSRRKVGRRVDESSPMVDCRLPDGSRVNIILPPLAVHSPCISIRKFPSRRYDIAGMIENGTMTPAIGRLLEIAARCRLNILVSGGTGSGKTTLLNAMSQFVDHSERIVTIEDAAELQLQQPHVISLETRPPSLEGTGRRTARPGMECAAHAS